MRIPVSIGALHACFCAIIISTALLTTGCASGGPVEFTSPPHATFESGKNSSFAVSVANSAGELADRGQLPKGLAFHETVDGATISGTPLHGTGGTYRVTLMAHGDAGQPVRQKLTVVVDEAPNLATSATSQWSAVFGHMTFKITAVGYPAPRITLVGKLPPGLNFQPHLGSAIISGRLQLSWLQTIKAVAEVIGSVVLGVITGGGSLIAQFGLAAKTGLAAYSTLYSSQSVYLIASNSLGTTPPIMLTMRILGPN